MRIVAWLIRGSCRAVLGLVLLGATWVPAQDRDFTNDIRPLLDTYCFSCHGPQKQKGGLDLSKQLLPGTSTTADHGWDSIRRELAEQVMPPPEKPQPTAVERERLIAWIDRALEGPPGDPGWTTIRRLTRLEYNRTINDLLGVAGDPAQVLPADNAGGAGGFDNLADTLYVSSLFLERLLDASQSLVEQAAPERLGIVMPEKDKKGDVTAQTRRKAVELSLAGFLPKAWRRPVTTSEIAALVKLYERAIKRPNAVHDDAVRLVYAAALSSPNFLFRHEDARPGKEAYPVSAYELATRLAYFLWSSMPDDALTAAAKDGSLLTPEGITAQITRMLADPRVRILSQQFIGQWLGTDGLAHGEGPDPTLIRGYSDALRRSMIAEPVEFLHGLLTSNGSLLDLIDCSYVYVDAELARHYGLNASVNAKKAGFTKVTVSDGQRGGVVTMAAVLAITSRPSRTSPVIRGKWILQELLSSPPPPPPANVPDLPESAAGGAALGTLRERLERHRADPNCTSCHQRIDPLGFGLESFDALGRWRVRGDQGELLDTTGALPGGETFAGPQQLKKLLMQRHERIMTTVVERLLSYALGRGLERCDRSTVRQIVATLAADQWRAQTLVREIALSLPFRFKRNPDVAPAAALVTKEPRP